MIHPPGTLFIVATPIGNREDFSFRAIATLKTVDLILAEDTRHSLPLLAHFGIQKPLQSFHAHNEASKTEDIVLNLKNGLNVALISDAGTPLLSDPGFMLVKKAREVGIRVVPIPGPCALMAALSAAGIVVIPFTFCGFLPAKTKARLDVLKGYINTPHTLIFYESTHRIIDSLKDLATIFGPETPVVIAKELTKTHETIIQGTYAQLEAWLLQDHHDKGEFVILIPPRAPQEAKDYEPVLTLLLKEVPLKKAVQLTAQITGGNKNQIYEAALKSKKH